MVAALVLVVGLIIGSFLSVCIYRIPAARIDELVGDELDVVAPQPVPKLERPLTIAYPPRSFCPSCANQLKWWHNVPVVSWLLLRGRCWFCKTRIPVRYPLVELCSGLLALLSYLHFGLSPTAMVVYLFCAALLVVSVIDYDFFIIPDVISIPGSFIGVALAALNQFYSIFQPPIVSGLWDSFLGFMSGAGMLYVISEVYLRLRKREGLGLGDVKLLAMTGVLFGPFASLYTIFIGSLLGSVIGIVLLLVQRRGMSHYIPFGPYLAFATTLYLFTGDRLLTMIVDALLR